MDVQTLIAEPAVKRFDEGVFDGFAGRMKSRCTPRAKAQSSSARDMNSVPWSTVIDRGVWPFTKTRSRAALTVFPDMLESTSKIGTLATPLIDDRQDAELPTIGQGIVDEVHAPPRCSAMCFRRRTRIRNCRPSSRYNRRTRFLFTRQPSRRNSTQIRV